MRKSPLISSSFLPVAKRFKAILLDSFGVLKSSEGSIPGAENALMELRDHGIPFRILTNDASRSPQRLADRFAEQGLPDIAAGEIITSGMMARQFLSRKVSGGLIAYLGTEASAAYITRAGLRSVPVGDLTDPQSEEVAALVFLDDEGFDWQISLNKAVNLLRRHTIPAVVANTDTIYPTSARNVAIATGGIAKIIETILGRKFLHFGKPNTQMFNYGLQELQRETIFELDEVLMVGDTLHTDIMGGNKAGIKTMLVLSGNTVETEFEDEIHTTGIVPDFICRSIGH